MAERQEIKRLLDPEGMGSDLKMLVQAKGAMIGFGDVHTRAHIYRAIIEGLAYALREGGERGQRRSGVRLTPNSAQRSASEGRRCPGRRVAMRARSACSTVTHPPTQL